MPNKTRRKRGSAKRTLTKRSRRLMRHMRRIKTRRGGVKQRAADASASKRERNEADASASKRGRNESNEIRVFAHDYIQRAQIQLGEYDKNNLNLIIENPESLSGSIQLYENHKTEAQRDHEEWSRKSSEAGQSGWGPFSYQNQDFLNLLTAIYNHLYPAHQTAAQQYHETRTLDPGTLF